MIDFCFWSFKEVVVQGRGSTMKMYSASGLI